MYATQKPAPKSKQPTKPIQLVLQAAENGNRRDVPGTWTPASKLSEIMETMQSELVGVSLEHATMRYLQTIVPQAEWEKTSLKKMGLKEGGRALLILKLNAGGSGASSAPAVVAAAEEVPMESHNSSDPLESALQNLLDSNFDVDTKACIITMIKVLDNIVQKPNNPKVRSIRLANAAFSKKVVERKGGVDFLIACGFEVQAAPPALLSAKMDTGDDECLVLVNEETSQLIKARRLLMTKAIQELNMSAEDLPKYKPPPRLTEAGDHAAGRTPAANSNEFDPYKGQRYDAMSAAVGKSMGPDGNYVSPTEQQLEKLQSQQQKIESSMHNKPLLDREICASLPNTASSNSPAAVSATASNTSGQKSDGSLIASQFARQQQERRSRESQGFTTKAMRDLEMLKKKKIYSHAQLRIQFPDGTILEAKFLPKERISLVKKVIQEECLMRASAYDFDLYVAPPRRKLEEKETLEAQGLVPAAKVFLSWKGGSAPPKSAPVGTFLQSQLFREDAKPAYPSARALVDGEVQEPDAQQPTAKKTKPDKASREEEMVRRMMGQGRGLGGGGAKKGGKPSGGKPKWFKS